MVTLTAFHVLWFQAGFRQWEPVGWQERECGQSIYRPGTFPVRVSRLVVSSEKRLLVFSRWSVLPDCPF